jgi:hypothetical protein
MEITASILDYLGKYEDGILVSVGLMYKGEFFNSIFYYTGEQMIINVEDKMIEKMGHYIEEHPEYYDMLKDIISKVEPYDLVINQLQEINTHDEH